MARICAETLASGSRCTQFARKGQPWCRNHSHPSQRERNADARQIVVMISKMDTFGVTLVLSNTLQELRGKLIPPIYAQTIFTAAATRLERLMEEQFLHAANPNQNNGLHAIPMK